jgi:protein CpxP
MEKSKFLMIVVIFLLVLNVGTLSFMLITRGGPPHGHPHGNGPADFIIKELGFDDQQQAAFNDLKSEHRQQMTMIEDSLRKQRELLPELIVSGDRAKADSLATIIGNGQKKIEMYTFDHFVKVRALCNEEQKKKFKEIIGEILQMMGPRKGGPPPR